MPATQNINEEEILCLLCSRYLSLKIKLENTAYQIKALNGKLPVMDELYLSSLEKHKRVLSQSRILKNQWAGKIIDVMHEQASPCTTKEISAHLYAMEQSLVSLPDIQRQVIRALRLLTDNGSIKKYLNSSNKYVLQ